MEESVNKRAHAQLMYEQREAHLGNLPPQILLDLARNEAATREWRKAAVQLLLDHNFPQAAHPDLATLVMEINNEHTAKHDVQAVVESAIEEELPFAASVTTRSLVHDDIIDNVSRQPQVIRNPDKLNDDALVGE